MNTSINLEDWYDAIQDALWWENLHPDYAIVLYKYTKRAHEEGLQYYIKSPTGNDVNLTKIFEQFKLIQLLKAEYE